MLTRTTIRNEEGLHARPSTLIVKAANGFASTITLRIGARSADAKSIMEVMMLASPKGTQVTIEAAGADAEAAVRAIEELFERGFGETIR